jgi:uncharacterized membrane protein YfhO
LIKRTIPDAIGTLPNILRYRLFPPAVALLVLTVIAVIVFRNFLLGKYVYLYKDIGRDSINIAYPAFVHYADYLRSWGIPAWSFCQGMGQWIFPFSFNDPFNTILYCLGSQNIAYAMAYIEIFKILCAGMLFFAFLRTALVPVSVAVIGGILYAFSGFAIVGSCWSIFTTEAVYFALLLLSVEQLLRNGSWFLFPLWVALISMLQPFYLFIYGIFLVFYLLFRLSLLPAIHPREWARIAAKLLLLGLLGAAMASVIMIPEIAQMLDSPRAGEASYLKNLMSTPIFSMTDPLQCVTLIYRLFSSDMVGTGNGFSGWYNYLEAPVLYCGLINLVAAPQAFLFAGKRRSLHYVMFAIFMLLPLVFPFFRYAFWMFSGSYYRALSLMEATCILLLGCQGLAHILRHGRCNIPLLFVSATILLAFLYNPFSSGLVYINKDLRVLAALLILVNVSMLTVFGLGKLRNIFPLLLLAFVIFEACCFSFITINDRFILSTKELKAKGGYNDYSVEAIRWLGDIDSGFFRVDKTYHSGWAGQGSLNDAKLQHYYGTSSYYSFNQYSYIKFLATMGIISDQNEAQTRWAPGLRSRPLLQSIASVKYILTKDTTFQSETWYYRQLKQSGKYYITKDTSLLSYIWSYRQIRRFGDVYVMQNRLAFPFGFTYDSIVPLSSFLRLPDPIKDLTLLRAAVINDSSLALFSWLNHASIQNTLPDSIPLKQLAEGYAFRKRDTLVIERHSQNRISGSITLTTKKLLFFSIPFDRGWHAVVDGHPVRLECVSIGFTGLAVDEGRHCIELYFRSALLLKGAIISIVGIALYLVLIFVRMALSRRHKVTERRDVVSSSEKYFA